MQQNTSQIGKYGEDIALEKYQEMGYTLVTKNFNYYQGDKIGEIDLIVEKNNILHLVEVKLRKNENFANTLEQITKKKLSCIYKSYLGFVKKYPKYNQYFVQLDVVTIVNNDIQIYQNCYSFESIIK